MTDTESIQVEWDEALDISTDMKLRAADLQKQATQCRSSGDHRTASTLDSKAARLDAFADKLLAPFMDAEDIEKLNTAVEA